MAATRARSHGNTDSAEPGRTSLQMNCTEAFPCNLEDEEQKVRCERHDVQRRWAGQHKKSQCDGA